MNFVTKVSIGQWAFTLEEEAYEWLKAYLESAREHDKATTGKESDTEDIEKQIGNYLASRIQSLDQVVSLSQIQQCIKALGLPCFSEESSSEKQHSHKQQDTPTERSHDKKLYRDSERRVLGGVFSGFGHYFGIDAVVLRLFYLLLLGLVFIIHDKSILTFIILYLAAWLIVPAAKTDSEKEAMRHQNTKNEHKRIVNDFRQQSKDVVNDIRTSSFLQAIGSILRVFIGIVFIIIGSCGLILLPLFLFWEMPFEIKIFEIINIFPFGEKGVISYILLIISLLIPVLLFLYEGIRLLFNLHFRKLRLGLILLVCWIISIIVLGTISFCTSQQLRAHSQGAYETSLPLADTLYIELSDDIQKQGSIVFASEDFYSLWRKNDKEQLEMSLLPIIQVFHDKRSASVKLRTRSYGRYFHFSPPVIFQEFVQIDHNRISISPTTFNRSNRWHFELSKLEIHVPQSCSIYFRENSSTPWKRLYEGQIYLPFIGEDENNLILRRL